VGPYWPSAGSQTSGISRNSVLNLQGSVRTGRGSGWERLPVMTESFLSFRSAAADTQAKWRNLSEEDGRVHPLAPLKRGNECEGEWCAGGSLGKVGERDFSATPEYRLRSK
jgi:hypothetical protein